MVSDDESDAVEEANERGEPYIAVKARSDGKYAATFDMATVAAEMSEDASDDIVAIMEEEREVLEEIYDPEEEDDYIGIRGRHTYMAMNNIRKEKDARDVASDISEIVLDEENWVSTGNL